ncbi:MAG: right-handed parallel beta-helix repeat-containing protein [Bacteroidales bacterium]|nr:right-handed parallel beta-helix repeat-containing protein [Bacteroidales bacterium]MCB8998607.1 right-handed parallel beta-helix repeat-containing protein [Bacteroidales bacterium]MCB9012525.1 right-handed parallel beta-helix repeat-containing protein [Bacteroidales bacterium]
MGVYLEGTSNTVLATGTKILSNTFNNQYEYGVYLKNQNAPQVNSNSVLLKTNIGSGIYFEYCDNNFQIQKNKIVLPSGQYGIYINYCDANSISRSLVANNFVSITGGSYANGIYLYNSTFQNIYHNSVSITSVSTGDYGAFMLNLGSNIDVRNNIFANFGEGYAYNIKTPAALEYSDNNDYYSNGNYLAYWGAPREDLSLLKAAQAPAMDAGSISFNPVFLSSTDLHGGSFRIDNKGVNLGVTQDIDGQTRTNYDIGADEFTGTGSAIAAGTYTLGGSSPNYTSFGQVADILNTYGISGNVTFNVRNGTYSEQFTLGPIAGTSASSKVVFTSESGDSTKAELTIISGVSNDYIVRFTGADYVTFKKLSFTSTNTNYHRIFWFCGSSSNNTITSCILNGDKTGAGSDALIYSYDCNTNFLTITGNIISGGHYGVYVNPNAQAKQLGCKITGNTFNSQIGGYANSIYMRYQDAPEIRSNTISSNSSYYYYGIYLQDCINDLKITGNKINAISGDVGIGLYSCKSISTKRGLIANNFIDVGGTGNAYGIYTYNSDYQDVYYNTVRITNTNITSGRAYYNAGNSSNINIKNNLFTNFGEGYVFYSEGTTVNFTSNYNGFYTTGNFPFYWNGVAYNSLANYTAAASPLDANSISANPVFVSSLDLHAQSSYVDNKAVALTEVTTDIDGQLRSLSTPDLGADEFTSIFTPLAAGSYTIGGSSPSYPNFTAAVNDLNVRGISGPVVFNVRAGTYNEQFSIYDINGASTVNTILFQSESGDSTTVELSFNANANARHVIQLNGTDFISFKRLTFSSLNSSYALVFYLRGGIQKLNIQNCIINSSGTNGSEINTAAIYSDNASLTDFLFDNCLVNGGRTGIYLESPSNALSTGTRIANSKFTAQGYDALVLKYHSAPRIENNFINNTSANTYFKGIYLQYCSGDLNVQSNSLLLPSGGNGIYLSYCIGNTSKKGLLVNNAVNITGTSSAVGITLEYSDYQRVYYNSVRNNSLDINFGKAFNTYSGSNNDVRNNIFANFGGGYAYYTNSATNITTSDFNNLFTIGNYLAYYNANCSDLNSLRSLSSKETNSVSYNPVFSADMHSKSSFINNKATPIAAVTKDIDGENRSASTPDIGADEFTPVVTPMSGNYTIGGTSPDFATFSDAAAGLNERGVSGPVVLNIRNGSYSEHFDLFEISGASATNTIVFQSETGDSSLVILSYNAVSAANDYVIRLIGTDYVTFRKITIAGTNQSYSTLVVLNGNVTNLSLQKCVLSVNDNSSGYAVYSPDGSVFSNVNILNNKFLGGNGIYLNGFASVLSPGINVAGNSFINQQSYGLRLEDMDGALISGNQFESSKYSYTAIYLYNCDGKLNASSNRIFTQNNSTGIYLGGCNGTLINQGIIANNYVAIGGDSYSTGITVNSSEYQNVVYNSVNISSTYSSQTNKIAFYLNGGDNIFIRNNIFACINGGYAYYIGTPAAADISDYNDYYSNSNIAYWNGIKASFADLRTANGTDLNSLNVNPLFASASDLRTKQNLFHKAAFPLVIVTQDINGIARDLLKPDIGATEFSCGTPVFNISSSASCLGDSTVFTYSISNVSFGSNFSFDFDNDFNPDTSFTTASGKVRYLYPNAGSKTVNLIASQIAGCNDYSSKTISIETAPNIEITAKGAYCGQSNGSAVVHIPGGTGPFSYRWSNGNITDSIYNLEKGQYSVTVRNQNNCISTASFEIGDRIVAAVNELLPSSCGQTNGSAIVTASGGSAPYSYVWSNGETAATAVLLPSGPNYVSISDATGCSTVASINVTTDPSGPKISIKKIVQNSCYGDKNGSIDVNVIGGSKPYTFQWSNGETTEDILNVASGIYDLKVTDNTGCIASSTFGIEQPVFLNVSTVVENASCNGSDGKAVALTGGGSKPYKYLWSSGSTEPVASNLAAGIYTLTVTDLNNCTLTTPVLINNTGGPTVSLNKLKGVSCGNSASGSIDISISGGTPLYSYSWLPGGQTSQDLSNLVEGDYKVSVTDNAGCVGVNSFVIGKEAPLVNPICLVTVDSISGKNLIVWEKLSQPGVASYNIYRESSSKGNFQLIASVPAADPSEFVDEIADPSLRSWKYKLSVSDDCGNESAMSDAHKTIHLTQNLGLKGVVNLIWDKYEGFDVSTYKIYRYSKSEGWRTLTSLPSDLFSFTDPNPLINEELSYVIEVENPNGSCSSLKASTYNSSRSNRQVVFNNPTGLNIPKTDGSVRVYPNPASTEFSVEINQPGLQKLAIELIDANGRVLRNYMFKPDHDDFNTRIEVNGIPAGVYILKISRDSSVDYNRLIIQP